ncbi:hypothetical protein GPJ56_008168 [Histomonas meleagridis]|uniref:uncharacterized protein n=1 Tax=Histomonas meleagridis TaxID=135588 RepID=UPI003559EC4B|nr:hypothetical protein GPJ56_008168 [Histomonas meleagridis]KAH0797189.1 hypothetical protein GO595_009871 [Histomonas meleagridis]
MSGWSKLLSVGKVDELASLLGCDIDGLKNYINSSSTSISQPKGNDLWITSLDGTWGTWDGKVISIYYHSYNRHSATTVGKLGFKRSVAEAGHWAVSIQTRALGGNKAYYNNDFK